MRTLGVMFHEALRDIVESTDGSLAGILMDSQGARIDSYARPGAGFDIDEVGVEYGVLLGSIRKATEQLAAGVTQEVAIGTDKMITLIRTLGESYYLALALRPDGNFGKGRFMMRTAAPKLMAELA
jgi:predicted regulator of Ras-like GTPase activity (Roadblock/LC7/MglB family)